MPLTIINIFAVMEIIGLFRHYEVLQKTEVISLVDCHAFLRKLAMTIINKKIQLYPDYIKFIKISQL